MQKEDRLLAYFVVPSRGDRVTCILGGQSDRPHRILKQSQCEGCLGFDHGRHVARGGGVEQ